MQLLTAQANEVSTKESKNTIAAIHVTSALKQLDFEQLLGSRASEAASQECSPPPHRVRPYQPSIPPRAWQPAKKKQKLKPASCNLSQEELLRMQKELFAGSRQKLESEEQGEGPT